MSQEKICVICGKTYVNLYHQYNTCSKLCGYEYRKKNSRKEIECPTCKKRFLVYTKSKRIFCSRKCSSINLSMGVLKKTCLFCKKEFLAKISEANRGLKKFCSHGCYSNSLKLFRSKEFKKEKSLKILHKLRYGGNREAVFIRDNYSCQQCGKTDNLEIHHKDNSGWKSLGTYKLSNNRIENLITLCHSCHSKLPKTKKSKNCQAYSR